MQKKWPIISLITRVVSDEEDVEEKATEKDQEKEGQPVIGFLTNRPFKVDLVLDSGANEFMFRNQELAAQIESKNSDCDCGRR